MLLFEKMTFPVLTNLLCEVYDIEHNNRTENDKGYNVLYQRQRTLVNVLQKYNYSPTIQLKNFLDNSGLIILYNSNKKNEYDVDENLPIFKECRSIVLDLLADAPEKSIVSSMQMEIPIHVSDTMYKSMYTQDDVIEAGYEGTIIHVYFYKDKWHFSTTACPTIDQSRYFHPTKTHGNMFDEFIAKNMEEGSKTLRDTFTSHLDKSKKYLFVLIHHENRRVIDYTSLYGPEYVKLLHISTQTEDFTVEKLDDQPFASIGVMYPLKFATVEEGLSWLTQNDTSYALIVMNQNRLLIVSTEDTMYKETINIGNAHPWQNMLWIYLQNRHDIMVNSYAESKDILPIEMETTGKIISPEFLIRSAITSITDHLYQTYCCTTYYNKNTGFISVEKNIHKSLAPILRFHMIQLRNIQKTTHTDRLLTHKAISHYLRYHQPIKNIRLLIKYFAENPNVMNVSEENLFCIRKLHELLLFK